VKGGDDPLVSVTHVSLFSGTAALILLPLVALPRPDVWPWLALSALLHTAYRFFLIGAYRSGDLFHVYPIARGAAPLMTAIGTLWLLGENIGALGFAAVVLLSGGVFLMSLRGGRLGGLEPKAVAFAFGSAASTCAYTLVDGFGARLNGSGPGFALWMFVLNATTMQVIALAVRGPEVYATLSRSWPVPLGGGLMSMCAYFIVIWGMTKAPIALVAALRETSVLFAAVIATVLLKEPLTPWRIAASALVVAGVALLRLA
jgi:drug/metabolite transporter (DMT)-like permease